MNSIRGCINIREFRPAIDLPHLVSLCAAIEDADQTGIKINEATLNAEVWKRRWLMERSDSPEMIIGHGWIFEQSVVRSILSVAIHPTYRKNGYGSNLLTFLLDQAKALGAQQFVCSIQHDNVAADGFLCHHGFTPKGNNRFFAAPADFTKAKPDWPEGFFVRSFATVQSLAVLAEAHNRCYADMWGHTENTQRITEEQLSEWMKEYPEFFTPEGIFIAFTSDDEVAGVCYGKLLTDPSSGEKRRIVDSPGVVPECRHMKLQHPLTLITTNWLKSFGTGSIELHTYGDSENAVAIYLQLGFELEDHWIEYLKV